MRELLKRLLEASPFVPLTVYTSDEGYFAIESPDNVTLLEGAIKVEVLNRARYYALTHIVYVEEGVMHRM